MATDQGLKKLQRTWYMKLKADGFEDIETLLSNGELAQLMKHSAHTYKTIRSYALTEETQTFYRLACWFYHEYEFPELIDKQIWELFAEGKTMRDIGNAVSLSVRAVHRRIHKMIRGPFQDYRKMVFHDAN